MRRSLDLAVVVSVGILTAVLTLGAALNSRNLRALMDDAAQVNHTYQVRELILSAKASMFEAAARQRAFLLAGRPESLASMSAAIRDLQADVAGLKKATTDNPAQQARMGELDELVAAYAATLNSGVTLRQGGAEGAALAEAADAVRENIGPLKEMAATMFREEAGLLENRESRVTSAYHHATAGAVGTVVMGLGFFWAVMRLVQRNLTNQARAASVLHQERERLHVTLNSIGDAVIATDGVGKITFINPVAQQLTAWKPDEAIGLPLDRVLNIVNESSRQTVESPVDRVLAEGVVVGLANHTLLIARDGTERPIADSAAPIKDEQGAVTGVVLVFRDVSEQRSLDLKIRERDDYIRQLIDSTAEGIYGVDLEGRCTFSNPSCLKMLGYQKPEEMLGKGMHDLIHYALADGTPLPPSECRIHAALNQGMGIHVSDEHFWRGDGTHFPVEYWAYPVRSGGEVVGGVVTFLDVSERIDADKTRAERARMASLRGEVSANLAGLDDQSEALLKSLQAIVRHSSAEAAQVWTVDDGHYAARLQEGAGLAVRGRADSTESTSLKDVVDQLVKSSEPLAISDLRSDSRLEAISFGSPDAKMAFAGLPMEIEGKLVGVLRIFSREPLSEREGEELQPLADQIAQFIVRRRALVALAENERQFRQWADSIPQLAWMARPDGTVFWYNQRWYDFTGMTPDDANSDWQSVHDPEELPRVRDKFARSVSRGEPWEDTFPLRRRDGEYRWHLSRALPIRDSGGQIVRWFGTHTDVTNQRLAEEALRAADARKDQFLATLAHELRNPLAPLVASAQLIALEPEKTAQVVEYATLAQRQCDQLRRLIDDLLDISRISTGKFQLQRQAIRLQAAIETALEMAQPVIEEFRHALHQSVPSEPIDLLADEVRVAQIVANLLINAAKYTPAGGEITLDVAPLPGELQLSVRDTGIGIPPDKIGDIFELFTQVDNSPTRSQGGLGIGLTLVKTLVELHGGRVAAASDGAGKGSVFTVWLPLAPDVHVASESGDGSQKDAALPQRKILVVDDNATASLLLRRLLEKLGQRVEVVNDPLEALACVAKFRPEVVFSDIAMPKMSGYELVGGLRELKLTPQPLLIALTGYGQHSDRTDALKSGFDEHLVKPIGLERLRSVLEALGPATGKQRKTPQGKR